MRQSPPPKKPRQITLTKLAHVRSELARLYSEARNGHFNVADASKLAHMLQILAKILEAGQLESRVEALEQSILKEKQP